MTRTALITGANRGLGEETARRLLDLGLRVVLTARAGADAEAARDRLDPGGARTLALPLDLADEAAAGRAAADLAARGWQVDVLVNNGGVYAAGDAQASPAAAWDLAWTVNARGAALATQAFLPGMIARGYGRVVNVSSAAGSFGEGMLLDHAPYSVSKAAMNAVTFCFAGIVGAPDVKINACSPGWVRTRMGGPEATRSVAEGADTIVWLATLPADGPTGGFFRDRRPLAW